MVMNANLEKPVSVPVSFKCQLPRKETVFPYRFVGDMTWAAAPGGGGRGDRSPAIFSAFNIMPMGVAWK